jgi:hypothetical protein
LVRYGSFIGLSAADGCCSEFPAFWMGGRAGSAFYPVPFARSAGADSLPSPSPSSSVSACLPACLRCPHQAECRMQNAECPWRLASPTRTLVGGRARTRTGECLSVSAPTGKFDPERDPHRPCRGYVGMPTRGRDQSGNPNC